MHTAIEANEKAIQVAHARRAELVGSVTFWSDWVAPEWLADVNDDGLSPGEALAAMKKPAALVDAEAVLVELWTRREAVGVRIRELSRAKDDDRHSARGRELSELRGELEAIDAAIQKARNERDALRLPFGDMVAERMKPIGELAAVRLLQAADDFREAVRTLQGVANVNASHLAVRMDQPSKYYGTAVTSLPLHSLRDVDPHAVRAPRSRRAGDLLMTRPLTIRGIACNFNVEAVIEAEGGVRETVAPGAFDLASFDIKVLYGLHDGVPIARQYGGSAHFFQDRHGLKFEAQMPDTWRGLNAFNSVARGDVSRCSVDFISMEKTETVAAGVKHRRITRARIDHVAISASPVCYKTTAVWPVLEDRYDLPPHLRRLDDQWRIGNSLARIEADRRRRESARPVALDHARRLMPHRRSPAGRAEPNPETLRGYRKNMLALARGSGIPVIIGHAAFTRHGGAGEKSGW